ncbi:MAG: T9SS type A sorting domain-containing protein [Ignavibacteriaceae bacterium]|jgi:hypothetical protein
MRKLFLLLTVITFLPLTSILSQPNPDMILKESGDSLWIKDDLDYGFNTLYTVINDDTLNVPAGRVYVLKANGYYSLINTVISSDTRRTIIMGENQGSVKTSQGAAPPIITGAFDADNNAIGGINSGSDLLVKNVDIEIGNSGGSIGWAYLGFSGPGKSFQLDNSIVEHTWWVVFGSVQADSKIFLTNDYFVNMDGHTCRRNGGVVDFNGGVTEDTLLVENCTHVNHQGSIYKSRTGYTINRQIFNHNDFIDCAGYVFMNTGDHTDFSVTNNIFVNCNVQPYSPVLGLIDVGELDPDELPMGLVNVYDDSAFTANGATFYVDKNLVYWDPTLTDASNGVVATVNANQVNGQTDWVSQMITMNSRSQSMFDDNTNYPLLTEGDWFNKLPNFANTDVLFSDQLAVIKTFAIATVDTSFTGPLASWRQPDNPEATYFTYADWPVPIDLSYDDADLMTAGLNGFPLGDLNWFPDKYTEWMAQRDAELTQINDVLYNGTAVREVAGNPTSFKLSQNYPNPFNPTTVINFTIPKAGNVTLKVYNSLGQEVATLINGFKNASNYKVDFNASNLSSGVYFYTLEANNFKQTKKMVLIK